MIAENNAIKIQNYFPIFLNSVLIFVEKDYVWISSQLLFFNMYFFVNTAHYINLKYTRQPGKYAELYQLQFKCH